MQTESKSTTPTGRVTPVLENATSRRTTMKAIVQEKYGEVQDVLRLEDIDRPEIGDNEVVLRVHAAGVDRDVWHLMTGLAYPVRLAGYGVRAPKTRVRGREVAGRVEALGKTVTTVQVDDFAESQDRYDVIIDTGGHRSLRHLRRALTPRGTLVIVGSETGGRWLGGFDRQLRALMLSPFIGQRLSTFVVSESAEDLLILTDSSTAWTSAPG